MTSRPLSHDRPCPPPPGALPPARGPRSHAARVLLAGLVALTAVAAPAVAPATDQAPAVAQILARYASATRDDDTSTFEAVGTIAGEGLSGDFHSWRAGDDERSDERLGPRLEITLRRGDEIYVRSASGNVRELAGYLKRRALTATFVDSGAFVKQPQRSRFVGFGTLAGKQLWRLEVCADGGEPETLWIDPDSGLPARVEFVDGDGPTTIDYADWRPIDGRMLAFRMTTSDGDHQFDIVQQTTSVTIGKPIASDVFTPLVNRTLVADGVQTVPLMEQDGHVSCRVQIAGKPYAFLLDTGAQSVLLDASVAGAAGLASVGSLEVRGATRTGGLHLVKLARLDIGSAHLDDLVASTLDLRGALGSQTRLDGILGFPFFASSLVELDFAHLTMRFGPPGSFIPQGERVPLDLDRGLIEADAQVSRSLTAPFIIDTGNSGELLLYRPFISAHPGVVPFSSQSIANYGIGGSTPTFRSQLDELAIGGIPLYHRVADVVMATKGAFADRVDAGNIGLGILKNFVVTFDLANDAVYFARGASFDDGRMRVAAAPH